MTATTELPSSTDDGKKRTPHAATSPEPVTTRQNGNRDAQSSMPPVKVLHQIVSFFERNPGKELTILDATTKFGIARRTAEARLSEMTSAGILERVSVYRLKAKD